MQRSAKLAMARVDNNRLTDGIMNRRYNDRRRIMVTGEGAGFLRQHLIFRRRNPTRPMKALYLCHE